MELRRGRPPDLDARVGQGVLHEPDQEIALDGGDVDLHAPIIAPPDGRNIPSRLSSPGPRGYHPAS